MNHISQYTAFIILMILAAINLTAYLYDKEKYYYFKHAALVDLVLALIQLIPVFIL